MSQKRIQKSLLLISCIFLLAVTSSALASDNDLRHSHLTHEDVAAAEREYTYTTAEAVAAGRRAAERYWLYAYTIHEVAAAEREFTYTTAEAVERGRIAATAFCAAAIAC